jgi:hypothetical protein
MAVSGAPERTTAAAPAGGGYEEERGYGWMLFAGVMLCLVGTLNMIEGIAAIDNSHFFVGNAQYVAGDLNAWGWTVTIVGAVEILVGLGVFVKNQFARWLGVLVAGLNAIAQLMFINARPFWALALFTIDILIIYGLVAYGGRTRTAY